jgi:DNA-binding transcriptional LysR family regulator
MSSREPDWGELRTFLEVARDLSLSGAARRLGLAQPTVGRHIDGLEEALGATLFTRSPRGLVPTAAAKALVPHAEAMAVAAAALARSASSATATDRGVVRVTASEIMGSEALPPIFAGFRARNPGVVVESRSLTATRTSRAATPTSPCAWSARPRAALSRAVSVRHAFGFTRIATISPGLANRVRSPISSIVA